MRLFPAPLSLLLGFLATSAAQVCNPPCSSSQYCGTAGNTGSSPPATGACYSLKSAGQTCSSSAQCAPPTAGPNPPCLSNRCCMSTLCTSGCDSGGNCIAPCIWPPPAGAPIFTPSSPPDNVCFFQLSSASTTYGGYVCAQNFYGSAYSGSCTACPPGATTLTMNSPSSSSCLCPANTFLDTSGLSPACTACPAGTIAPVGSQGSYNCQGFSPIAAASTTSAALLGVIVALLVVAGSAALHASKACACCTDKFAALAKRRADGGAVRSASPTGSSNPLALPQGRAAPLAAGLTLPPGWKLGGPDVRFYSARPFACVPVFLREEPPIYTHTHTLTATKPPPQENGHTWYIDPSGHTQWEPPK